MAHNKLRRDILALVSRGGATVDPFEADTLLNRALATLGGPVEDNRPQGITAQTALVDNEPLTQYQKDVAAAHEGAMQGRDLGDESEYAAGLGTRHNDVNGNLVP